MEVRHLARIVVGNLLFCKAWVAFKWSGLVAFHSDSKPLAGDKDLNQLGLAAFRICFPRQVSWKSSPLWCPSGPRRRRKGTWDCRTRSQSLSESGCNRLLDVALVPLLAAPVGAWITMPCTEEAAKSAARVCFIALRGERAWKSAVSVVLVPAAAKATSDKSWTAHQRYILQEYIYVNIYIIYIHICMYVSLLA